MDVYSEKQLKASEPRSDGEFHYDFFKVSLIVNDHKSNKNDHSLFIYSHTCHSNLYEKHRRIYLEKCLSFFCLNNESHWGPMFFGRKNYVLMLFRKTIAFP